MNKSNTPYHHNNSNNTDLNIPKSMRFLNYLELFLANAKTKRVRGYGTVGLAYNTIRSYRSLYRIIGEFETDCEQWMYLDSFDKNMSENFTRYLKLYREYSDNYTGQLLKLLKVVLRDAQKSGHAIHPYSHYIEVFRQKKSDRIIHILNPDEIKNLIVFGAGKIATEIVKKTNFFRKIENFDLVDSDINKVGKKILNSEIKSPQIIKNDSRKIFIASAECYDEIHNYIKNLKGNTNSILNGIII